MPHHRRRSWRRRILGGAVGMGAVLLLACRRTPLSLPESPLSIGTLQRFFPPPELLLPVPPELLLSESPTRQESEADISYARRLLPVRRRSPLEDDAVLLPDDEVLVLAAEPAVGNAMCVFQGGASSPARPLGRLPGPGRHAYLCLLMPMPDSAQPLQAPRLLSSSPTPAPAPADHLIQARLLRSSASPAPAASSASPAPAASAAADHKLLSWSDSRLVFNSALLGGGDVLIFAKGRRQGINMSPLNVHCRYSGASMVAIFPAVTSVQQVTRCPSPPPSLNYDRVTLVLDEEPIPSIAAYGPNQSGLSVTHDKKLICACTMVRNVAKFLPEWVHYHAAIGIEQFYLYDNGSEDNLADQVAHLNAAGFNIQTVAWPWTKTQEAGFSHCAAVFRPACQWMAFVDIDEFIFSPDWNRFDNPSKAMLEEVVTVDQQLGQIYMLCLDFGPSGQTAHPVDGVCQGYVCRIEKPQRHKSLVRLDAVDDSLQNSIHHFKLKSGFDFKWTRLARVNHYKYQAWPEFKQKFKRRVSAYVTDWKDPVNLQSGDRAPGLGVEAIEPEGWAWNFCERNDSVMKEMSIKWFGVGLEGRGLTGDVSPSPPPSPSLSDSKI